MPTAIYALSEQWPMLMHLKPRRLRTTSCISRFYCWHWKPGGAGEISQGRLLEVGRLLDIEEETILELVD